MVHAFSHSLHKCTDTEFLSEGILSDSEACPFRCIIQCTAGDSPLMDVQDYLPSSFWSVPSLAALLHRGWHLSLFSAAVTNVVLSIRRIMTATIYEEGDVALKWYARAKWHYPVEIFFQSWYLPMCLLKICCFFQKCYIWTHAHTHIYIYIVCVRKSVCVVFVHTIIQMFCASDLFPPWTPLLSVWINNSLKFKYIRKSETIVFLLLTCLPFLCLYL